MRLVLLFCTAAALCGCARYEYDVVTPPALSGHAGSNTDKQFTLEQISYRLRSVDNHLVMRIENTTDETIQFLGSQSFVVDPKGQSHPFPSQAIAPHSFMKLILPPMHPQIGPAGPTIGIGIGTHVKRDVDSSGQPKYLQVYLDDANAMYWEWDDEADVRVRLTYQRGNDTFSHEFLFHRRKMP